MDLIVLARSGENAEVISATYSGGTNAMYHYEPGQSIWHTMVYFTAGFAGGFVGADVKGLGAYMLGGILNTTAGIITGNVDDEFSIAQHFVSGALATQTGKSFNKSLTKKALAESAMATVGEKKKSYMFKYGHKKFLSYGLQGSARDFTQAKDWESYTKKDMAHHFGTFFFSGLGGVMQGHAGENGLVDLTNNRISQTSIRLGLSVIGYGLEYLGMSYVKGNYQSLYTKGWEAKAEIYSFKSIMYTLTP